MDLSFLEAVAVVTCGQSEPCGVCRVCAVAYPGTDTVSGNAAVKMQIFTNGDFHIMS